MATEAKVIIKGEDQLSPSVKSAQNSLTGLQGVSTKLGATFKSAFKITAIIASVKALGQAAKQCYTDFFEADRAYRQLAASLGDTRAYKDVIDTIDSLSSVSLTAKDDIVEMVSQLASLGKSSDEIDKISRAAVAFSNVLGKDLNSSMELMLDTLTGNIGELEKYGLEVSGLTEEQLKQGEAIDVVINKFEGLSNTIANSSTQQSLKNMADSFDDMKESIGGVLDYSFGPWFQNIADGASKLFDGISTAFAGLVGVIQNFPEVFGLTLKLMFDMVLDTFSWDGIKGIITTIFQGLIVVAETAFNVIVTGIPKIIASLVKSLGLAVYTAVIEVVNLIQESVESLIHDLGTVVDYIPGLGDVAAAMKSVDFTSDNTDTSKLWEEVGNSVVSIGDNFMDTVDDALSGFGDFKETISNGVTQVYGESLKEYTDAVGAILKPALDASNTSNNALGKINFGEGSSSTSKSAANSFNSVYTLLESTFNGLEGSMKALDKLSESELKNLNISEVSDQFNAALREFSGEIIKAKTGLSGLTVEQKNQLADLMNSTSELSAEFRDFTKELQSEQNYAIANDIVGGLRNNIESGLSSVFSNMASSGGITGIFGAIADMSIGPILDTIQPLLDIIDSIANPLTIIQQILQGFVDVMAPLMEAVVKPLTDFFHLFGELIAGLFVPLLERLYPIIWQIAEILEWTIMPIFDILTPILELISMLLTALYPVLDIVAVATITVGSVFGWLGDWIKHIVTTIWNWLRSINIFGWHPFGSGYTETHAPKDLFSYIGDNLAEYRGESNKVKGSNLGDDEEEEDTSTNTSITSASYSGSTTVHINIYQQAPVVGDGGMSEFARMIRKEFEELNYYGVTT